MKRTSANSVKFTFIARFLLSPGRYVLDAWLASKPARVIIWAGVAGSTQSYTCHHLGGDNSSVTSVYHPTLRVSPSGLENR